MAISIVTHGSKRASQTEHEIEIHPSSEPLVHVFHDVPPDGSMVSFEESEVGDRQERRWVWVVEPQPQLAVAIIDLDVGPSANSYDRQRSLAAANLNRILPAATFKIFAKRRFEVGFGGCLKDL
jgi:hypothetical protein